MSNKLLVVAPHCDDEVLACGATIVKLLKQGWEVDVYPCSYNEKAHSGKHTMKEEKEKVIHQLYRSGDILGFSVVGIESNAGGDMYLEPRGLLMEDLIRIIRLKRPDLVITTHPKDFHTDHRAVAVATKEAVYQAPRKGICGSTESFQEPLLLYGEVDMEGITDMKCHVHSEVTEEELQKKIKALQVYEGFVDNHPNQGGIFTAAHGRDWVMSLARLRGMHSGCHYAEVFELANCNSKISLSQLF